MSSYPSPDFYDEVMYSNNLLSHDLCPLHSIPPHDRPSIKRRRNFCLFPTLFCCVIVRHELASFELALVIRGGRGVLAFPLHFLLLFYQRVMRRQRYFDEFHLIFLVFLGVNSSVFFAQNFGMSANQTFGSQSKHSSLSRSGTKRCFSISTL